MELFYEIIGLGCSTADNQIEKSVFEPEATLVVLCDAMLEEDHLFVLEDMQYAIEPFGHLKGQRGVTRPEVSAYQPMSLAEEFAVLV